jgi:hypothetical protein
MYFSTELVLFAENTDYLWTIILKFKTHSIKLHFPHKTGTEISCQLHGICLYVPVVFNYLHTEKVDGIRGSEHNHCGHHHELHPQ